MSKIKLHRILVLVLSVACAVAHVAAAQSNAVQLANVVNTVAGTGTATLFGDGGPASLADLNAPMGVAADNARNIYIADTGNHVIRRIDSITGNIATVAGSGGAGYAGDKGAATSAQLKAPAGVAIDAYGDIFIADTGNSCIRVVYEGGSTAAQLITLENPSVTAPVVGDIYTVAGTGTAGYSGDLGLASAAALSAVAHIAIDPSGDVYISDTGNNRVRVIYLGGTTTSALIKSSNATVTSPSLGFVYTVVGNGTAASTGDGAAAGLAAVNAPDGIAVDLSGNLFIAEYGGNRVRMVYEGGVLASALVTFDNATTAVASRIYTLAGTGSAAYGGDGGLGSLAKIKQPAGIYVDSADNLYIADSGNHVIRLLTASTGIVTTIAGNNGLGAGFAGDQGVATSAQFDTPSDVALDAQGRVIIADGINNNRLRVASSNSTLPATAVGGTSATQAIFLQVNSNIQLSAVSVVPSMGGATEFAAKLGSGCSLNTPLTAGTTCPLSVSFTPAYAGQRNVPLAVTDSNGNVYSLLLSGIGIGAQTVVLPGQMTTIVGSGTAGFKGDNGPATAASLNIPGNVAVDSAGNIFFSDKSNFCIRVVYEGGPVVARLIKIETGFTPTVGSIYTIAGIGGSNGSALAANNVLATSAKLWIPTNMAIDAADNVYFTEENKAIRMVSAQTGLLSTVVGNGTAGFAGDNGLGTNAELFLANGIAADNLGNLYIVDGSNFRIRKVVLATNVITTVAGTGTTGFSGDGGPATAAKISLPQAVAADIYGNLYIADAGGNERIRVIYGGGLPSVNPLANLITLMNPTVTAPVQGYIYTIAGTGTAGYSGDGGLANLAKIDFPYSLAVDAAANIYFPDEGSNHIRRIDAADGIIRTIGGYAATASPNGSALGDGGVATSAYTNKPYGVAVDALGNVYVADGSNYRIRLISNTAFPLTFPSTAVGANSASQTVTAVSIGNAPFDFAAFSINGQFAQVNSGTSSVPECVLATALAAGDSCTAAILFSPHSDGAVTGSISFAGSAPTQTVALSGTGTGGTASTLTLALPATATYASTVTATATVTAGGNPVTSGNVVFSNGTQTIATVALGAAGTASTALPLYAVGNYTITASYSAAGTANLQSAGSAAVTINPAMLTVTAASNSLVYGSPVPALTYTIAGFVNNETAASVVTGAPVLTTTATSTSADGAYPIVVSIGTLAAQNYTFALVNGTMTVSGATAQTITFPAIPDQVYGAAPLVLTPTSTSQLPVALTLVSGPALLSGNTVTITGTGTVVLQATQQGNVVYRKATPVTQSFNVLPAPLTVQVASANKLYGATNPAFTGTVNGLVNGDTLGNAILVNYASTAAASSLVGSYPITATVTGPSANNYTPVITNGVLTISPAPLMVAVANATRAYGSANPALSASITGLANGDSVGINLIETLSTTAGASSDIGAYPITATITGSSASQYAVNVIPGTLQVTAASLSISADSFTRLYGTANPTFTGSVTGALNGDSFTQAFATTATASTNAGRYSIVPSVTGAKLNDYVVTASNGTLTINLANSQLALTSSAASVNEGAPVLFTATATSTTTGTPTGSINFFDGSTLLATVALTNGSAAYTANNLLVGAHSITATYGGDLDFYGSSAAAVNTAVVAPGYSLTPSNTAVSLTAGGSASVNIQVSDLGGYSGTVTFSCGGLPAGASCAFAPSSLQLAPATAAQQTQLTIATQSNVASLQQPGGSKSPGGIAFATFLPGVLGILMIVRSRKRLRLAGYFAVLLLSACFALAVSGCGGASNSTATTVAPGTYLITVQVNASTGSSSSLNLTLKVN